jgi:hypothetical protein
MIVSRPRHVPDMGFGTALVVGACVLLAAGIVVAIVAPPRSDVARTRRARHEHEVTTA